MNILFPKQLLFCFSGNTDVDKDCIAEMDIVRASLMSDYQVIDASTSLLQFA